MRFPCLLAIFAVLVPACSASEPSAASPTSTAPDAAAPAEPDPLVVARPYELRAPANHDPAVPAPLVIALHGYGDGDDAAKLEAWLELAPVASERGYLYALPNGTVDKSNERFWNGTDACCDFFRSGVDDVAYIKALIDDVARNQALDRQRVFVTGVSGGGVMAHRLACDLSEDIAGIVSISGTTWLVPSKCTPSSGVAVAELHGDADEVVPYDGGDAQGVFVPGARETVAQWAKHNECSGELRARGEPLDLESSVPGAETQVEAYEGCARGSVELWTAKGGPHAPRFTEAFRAKVFDFFASNPKTP